MFRSLAPRVGLVARSSLARSAPRAVLSIRSSSSAAITKDDLEHATGAERAELEAELRGEKIFEDSGLSGPFGTREKPVVVRSSFSRRTVACTGGAGHDEHELLWFNLFEGPKHICPECGQFFVLKHV
eukprot:c11071_g3_i1.p1 GENE.c11071_g3_i1~~c11071_g3_i1.p1  ORF type:complete len:141 (+),score=29.35 c11071_g3_i1:42-425(+)